MRVAWFSFAPINVKFAVPAYLVRANNVARAVHTREDANALAVRAKTIAAEMRQLRQLRRIVRIGLVLVNPVAFVGVINMAQCVVHRPCFNLPRTAENAEVAHESSLHAALSIIGQAVLSQISRGRRYSDTPIGAVCSPVRSVKTRLLPFDVMSFSPFAATRVQP